ncbi:UbiA family prenyltransferase [Candidatus Sumerlaeota bacterium]|nr:UbiA family prenyltransferase [Candidatus Sumerlaeota bacterium]
MNLARKIQYFMSMIKIAHMVFALPFALAAMCLAAMRRGGTPWPAWQEAALILLACYAARTAAMTYNRIADREIDAQNPRTKNRELVTGALSLNFARMMLIVHVALFVLAAWGLNTLALALSPVCLAVLLGYSHMKRFSWLSHAGLGLALGLAPVGAWIAIEGAAAFQRPEPWLLMLSVFCWVAGFDVIYACQDYETDLRIGLRSIPARFGLAGAFRITHALHFLSGAGFFVFWRVAGLGWLSLGGIILMCMLLAYENAIITPRDQSRLNTAFFTVNGVVSLMFFVCVLGDLLL